MLNDRIWCWLVFWWCCIC